MAKKKSVRRPAKTTAATSKVRGPTRIAGARVARTDIANRDAAARLAKALPSAEIVDDPDDLLSNYR